MHRFVWRSAVGGVLFAMLSVGQHAGAKPVNELPSNARVLSIVAHADDDLLFVNPRIQQAIDGTAKVKTIVLTTGQVCRTPAEGGDSYLLRREEGLRQAYAQMVGVANRWHETRDAGTSTFRLAGSGRLTVTFLRLPEHGDWDGEPECGWGSLQELWNDPHLAIADRASDIGLPSTTYDADQLVSRLAAEIAAFRPSLILTLDGSDASAATSCSTGDHPDHRYSARFAEKAILRSGSDAAVERHRGYNTASEAANLSAEETARKRATFDTYGRWDWWAPDHAQNRQVIPAPASVGHASSATDICYQLWTERRYLR